MTTLWEQYEALTISADATTSAAIAIDPAQSHLIIKGDGAGPVLLLRSQGRTMPRAPIHLKHIRVAFGEVFEVRLKSDYPADLNIYTKLACSPDSISLHPWFVEFAGAIAQGLPATMSPDQVDELLVSLLEMFRHASPPSAEVVLGLWGELIAIYMAIDKSTYVRGWHSTLSETFDFDIDKNRVEVKTTLRSDRIHDFSLAQIGPARPGDFIVSIQARRATAGENVIGLARIIGECLPSHERDRLWRIVMATLGPEIDGIEEQRFDVETAVQGARLYQSANIPAPFVRPEFEALVNNVHFCANLVNLGNGISLAAVGLRP